MLVGFSSIAVSRNEVNKYISDELGSNFIKTTLEMGVDYDGKVVSTVIKRTPMIDSKKAVLYIHGFSDYFYQTDEAEQFYKNGYNFYAIDLRKYGRSILPNQVSFTVRNLNEYFPDIDSALNIIRKEGNENIIIVAHSMGGLVASLYLNQRKSIPGLEGVILNSPFLDFKQNKFSKKVIVPILSFIGRYFRNIKIPDGKRSVNCEAIHISCHGEWNFDTIKKPIGSGYVTTGWIRAIHKGHLLIKKGLNVKYPVLVLYSDKSTSGKSFSEISRRSDTVLDVKDIERLADKIGPYVTKVVIPGGIHDLVLSQKDVRENVYYQIFSWLSTINSNN